MAGVVSKPVFVKDGMYLSYVTDNAITIGNLVIVTTTATNTVDVAGAAATDCIGVAIGGDRFSRTATDNVIAAGQKVTIATRGIVNVYTGTSAIVRGSYLETGAAGIVELAGTAGTADMRYIVGMALEPNASAAATIQMKLMRG